MKVTTIATLEDASIGALTFVKLAITTQGSKTHISILGTDHSKSRTTLDLTVNTADIQRAIMSDQLDDGR